MSALVRGYCGVTDIGGNCKFGVSGAWRLSQQEKSSDGAAASACAAKCASCDGCNYFSVSRQQEDCSWFRRCSLRHLMHEISGFRTGVAVRKEQNKTAPRAEVRRQKRVQRLPEERSSREGCFDEGVSAMAHAEGRWVEADVSALPTDGDGSLTDDDGGHPFVCDRPSEHHRWVPSSCSLPRVMPRESLCSALRGKHMMVVGDSTGGQLYLSLASLLGASASLDPSTSG